ncbi:AbrB/MazE/SpoVT family DNA-binding domain-containing protein [Haloarculaceae archaeon H-GB1-1]|nr:AbrB/MazE/SpoVT family DNA-binding domain-containing protein [Haloarculaceae archaeon H-GB1-1]
MAREVESETTVNECFSVTVPAAVRREAGVEAGETLRWSVGEDGTLSVELVAERHGLVSKLEPIDVGEPTDAASDHDR